MKMLQLPSKVKSKQYIRMPQQNKVIDSDEEWSRCGKWILTNRTGSMSWIDETWVKLQVLLEKGCIVMIKASTAATTPCPGLPGTILCYTRPGKKEIERVAKEIRKIVHYQDCMYYKVNNMTENKIDHRYGHQRIPHYMHTLKGFFYEYSQIAQDWILVNGTKLENQRKDSFLIELKYNRQSTGSDQLISNTREDLLTVKSKFENLHTFSTLPCLRMWGTLEEVGNHLSEADRLWIVGKKLFDEGAIGAITCKKFATTAEFRFYFQDKLDIQSLVKLCDKIRQEAQVFRFIYILVVNVKYRYSPEKELYEMKFPKYL